MSYVLCIFTKVNVSLKRINKFMNSEELDPDTVRSLNNNAKQIQGICFHFNSTIYGSPASAFSAVFLQNFYAVSLLTTTILILNLGEPCRGLLQPGGGGWGRLQLGHQHGSAHTEEYQPAGPGGICILQKTHIGVIRFFGS